MKSNVQRALRQLNAFAEKTNQRRFEALSKSNFIVASNIEVDLACINNTITLIQEMRKELIILRGEKHERIQSEQRRN